MLRKILLLIGLGLLSAPSFAELPPVHQDFGDLSVWGSASQAFIWTDRHSFFGSEDDPLGYREITLGAQYRFLDRFSLNLQGEYRDAGESDNLGLRLGQAFVDGNFAAGEDTILGANLGRIEIPFALYNRTRDRIDTRPSIVLPQSIYLEGLNLRQYILTGDGAMFYGLHQLTKRSRIESRIALVRSSFGNTRRLEDALLVSGWADYVWDDALRLRVSMLHSEKDDSRLTFPVLSAQYLWEKWTFTTEWGRLQFDTPGGALGTNGVYGQVEYAVNKDFTLFGRYDFLKFDVDTPVPRDIPEDRLKGQGFAFGFGWDITKHIRLNAEYHRVDGKAWLNGGENPMIDTDASDWNMLGVVASFRF